MISLASDGLSYTNGNAYAIRLSGNASVGVQENDQLIGITMYPNPSEGLFTINTTEAGRYLVGVMNILGERVHRSESDDPLSGGHRTIENPAHQYGARGFFFRMPRRLRRCKRSINVLIPM